MNGATQLDLPLDVEHLAVTDTNARGDARGPAEQLRAHLHDREPVYLTDRFAVAFDQQALVTYGLERQGVDTSESPHLLIECTLYVDRPNDIASGDSREMIRLAQHVLEDALVDGEFA